MVQTLKFGKSKHIKMSSIKVNLITMLKASVTTKNAISKKSPKEYKYYIIMGGGKVRKKILCQDPLRQNS